MTGPMSPEAVQAASMAFKKALIERVLGAEPSDHLGYPTGAAKPEYAGNYRNGSAGKTLLTEDGPVRTEVPCDREGTCCALRRPAASTAAVATCAERLSPPRSMAWRSSRTDGSTRTGGNSAVFVTGTVVQMPCAAHRATGPAPKGARSFARDTVLPMSGRNAREARARHPGG